MSRPFVKCIYDFHIAIYQLEVSLTVIATCDFNMPGFPQEVTCASALLGTKASTAATKSGWKSCRWAGEPGWFAATTGSQAGTMTTGVDRLER